MSRQIINVHNVRHRLRYILIWAQPGPIGETEQKNTPKMHCQISRPSKCCFVRFAQVFLVNTVTLQSRPRSACTPCERQCRHSQPARYGAWGFHVVTQGLHPEPLLSCGSHLRSPVACTRGRGTTLAHRITWINSPITGTVALPALITSFK